MLRKVCFGFFVAVALVVVGGQSVNNAQSAIGSGVNCDRNATGRCGHRYDNKTEVITQRHTQVLQVGRKSKSGREIDGTTARKKKKKDTFYQILPMLIIPYLVQSSILPMMLMSIKFMLLKTFFVGKLALILIAINAFRKRYDNQNYMQHLMVKHYGYNGGDEYGSYVNY